MIRAASLLAMSLFLYFLPTGSQAASQNDLVIAWERNEGITPVVGFAGQFLEGISPVGTGSWLAHGASRRVGWLEP
jgi:hypothetical protein